MAHSRARSPEWKVLRFVDSPSETPPEPGAYILLVRLDMPLTVSLPRVRAATLAPGLYLYCGSAKGPGGLRARLARHMRRGKKPHWHIDRLTEAGAALGAWVESGGDECALVARLAHLPVPLDSFGSSDCPRCRSHLLHLPAEAEIPLMGPAFLRAQKC